MITVTGRDWTVCCLTFELSVSVEFPVQSLHDSSLVPNSLSYVSFSHHLLVFN